MRAQRRQSAAHPGAARLVATSEDIGQTRWVGRSGTGLALSAAFLLTTGCGERLTFVDAGDDDLYLAFIVGLDADGSVAAVGAPFGLSGGMPTMTGFELAADPSVEDFYVVSFAEADLGPGVLTDRLGEATLDRIVGFEPDPLEAIQPERRVPVSEETRRLRVDLDGQRLVDDHGPAPPSFLELVVSVPRNPEYCGVDRPAPGAYARSLEPLDADADARYRAAATLDEDSLLLMTPGHVTLVRRGGDASARLDIETLRPLSRFTSVSRGPRGRAFVSADNSRGRGVVFEVSVGDTIEVVGTTTAAPGRTSLPRFESLGWDDRGFLIGGSADGSVLVLDGGGARLFAPSPLSPADSRIISIAIGPNGHALGTNRSQVLLGDAFSNTWEPAPPLLSGDEAVEALSYAPDGELWAAGQASMLFRRAPQGAWEQVDILFPPSASECRDGAPRLSDAFIDILGVVAMAQDVYITPFGCSGAIRIHRDTLCTSGVLRPQQGLVPVQSINRALITAGDDVIAVASDGPVWTMR